ncbi:uncharacterized protein [Hyperolius riggenbachi]|uniref:uncharacterized protein isoform X2 n=1 Tax=Hyperolius riggenbachi TaxID=752182 RepID=UPI0035A38792
MMNLPTIEQRIPKCTESLRPDEGTKQKSPDWWTPEAVCSPPLFSQEEGWECHALQPDIGNGTISCCERVLNHQETSEDKSFPNRRDRLIENCLTFTSGKGKTSKLDGIPDRISSSSSYSESEESEIAHNSPTVLLEISSSSSSTGSPIDPRLAEVKQQTGWCACAEVTSDYSTEWESSNNDSQLAKDAGKTLSNLILLHHQALWNGRSLTCEYATSSEDMIHAVRNIKFPDETKQWAVDYLSQLDTSRKLLVKRKQTQ